MAVGVLMGSVLMVLGLVPGLFQELVVGVGSALSSFQGRPMVWDAGHIRQPKWLAGAGAILIALTLSL